MQEWLPGGVRQMPKGTAHNKKRSPAIHLIACAHEVFRDAEVAGLPLVGGVYPMVVPKRQQPCGAPPSFTAGSHAQKRLAIRERPVSLIKDTGLLIHDHALPLGDLLAC